jgi:hypothetical protein
MRTILKDPLLHFLFFGAIIYMVSTFFVGGEQNQQAIIVSKGQIQHLETLYKKTRQRAPSAEELKGLVDAHILEQAAYLEGVRLGLDRDDIVVKRRLRQKLDFIAEESVSRPEASDEQLSEYLRAHADQFRLDPTLTFRQIYLDKKTFGESLNQQSSEILAALKNNPEQDISGLGNRSVFASRYPSKSSFELIRLLGKQFTDSVITLEPGSWQGPIRSSYGLHLVYIESKQVGRLPELADIRGDVLQEWNNVLREKTVKAYYQQLLSRFNISIEWPEQQASATTETGVLTNRVE